MPAPPPLRSLLLAALLLGPAGPASAELVVLAGGGVLRVLSYELVDEDKVRLFLPRGAALTLPLLHVERILDAEVVRDPGPLPQPPRRFALRFRAGSHAPETPFGDLILEAAQRHSLNPELLVAVISAESAFDPRAVSAKGARGLLQLMPATALRFGVSPGELFEPARNLEAGSRYLAWLADRFEEELPLVLAAYNAGEGAVERHGGVPPYRETREYIGRVYVSLGLEEEGAAARR